MVFSPIEAIMISFLLIGYLILWRFRKHQIIRQHGVNPEVLHSDSRPSQKFFSHLTKAMSGYIVIIVALYCSGIMLFNEVFFLKNGIFNLLGFLLGLFGLFLCWKAQNEMGKSWRVGIDTENKTTLITSGAFQKIRNPTYSGFFLICIGLFFIAPTTAVMVWITVLYISIEFQVRIEEEFLTDTHGEEYTRYCQTTRRYIPYLY